MSPTPVRLAAIDIGSNAIKLRVVEVSADNTRRVLSESRYPIRLGEGTFETGLLSHDAIDACVTAFGEMADLCRSLKADHVRAVATSATREATNAKELVEAVLAETGIQIEVISGGEEARLLAIGMRPDLKPEAHNLIIDVGGGSTEIIYTTRSGDVDTAHSIRLGAVRLGQMVRSRDGRLGREAIEVLEETIESVLERAHLPVIARDTHVVGVAGTMRALNDAIHYGEAHPGISFSGRDLRQLIKRARAMDTNEMERRLGVESRRAPILLPGALIVLGILDLYSVDYITLSELGLRDGLLAEMALTNTGSQPTTPDADSAALRIGQKYGFDERHGVQVRDLAESLFDQLQAQHGLPLEWRTILRHAAMLHDIGQYVSYSKHHKHGFYLLSNEDFPGLTPRQQSLVATTVRYHRKSAPQDRHPEYASLNVEDQEHLRRTAALLRLADALDRQHHQAVTGVRVKASRQRVTLQLYARSPISLEVAACLKNASLFEEATMIGVDVEEVANG